MTAMIETTLRQERSIARRYRAGETLREIRKNPPKGLPRKMSLTTLTRILRASGIRKMRPRGRVPQ
jgi:hypothetical protein